jgi:hypothetical protein
VKLDVISSPATRNKVSRLNREPAASQKGDLRRIGREGKSGKETKLKVSLREKEMENMKVARMLALAAAATLTVATIANAAGRIWFDAVPVSTNAGVLTPPGSAKTDLVCDISLGLRCEWVVTIMYENFDGGATGSAVDFGTQTPEDQGKFTIKNVQLASNALQVSPNPFTINNADGRLLENVGGSNLTPGGANAGTYVIAQFTLSKNKLPGELQTSQLFAGVGGSEFGGNDPAGFDVYEVIQMGPNAPVPGYNAGWPDFRMPLAVMNVVNVPEPATLGLIGLGMLLVVRRRK